LAFGSKNVDSNENIEEKNLNFLGFVLFDNPVREDSLKVI